MNRSHECAPNQAERTGRGGHFFATFHWRPPGPYREGRRKLWGGGSGLNALKRFVSYSIGGNSHLKNLLDSGQIFAANICVTVNQETSCWLLNNLRRSR